jgi:hypothetical protein
MNSCIGCHEDRDSTPPPTQLAPLALERGAHSMSGWLGAERDFGFMAEVQPVFTEHCVSCHDYGAEACDVLNLAPDRTLVFNTAYMELHGKQLINVVGGGPNRVLDAYSWGSNVSRLVEVLDEGHHGVELSEEDYQRITTWIDLNAPYYPTYASAHDTGPAGRAPLSGAELETLQQLTGKKFNLGHGARPMLSFDRPELSPILVGLEQRDAETYSSALSIITSGKTRLTEKPRAGMPGFEPCETDRARLAKYDRLQRYQQLVRDALRNGEKIYDRDHVD